MQIDAIYYGDCKEILSKRKTDLERRWQRLGYDLPDQFVDLIYMDPPFFSGKKYEVIWHDGAEIRCFSDNHWYDETGKRRNSINAYLAFMRERIEACYNILKETGSFYLHCDWHASHYLKCILDEIFGYHNFRDEIIWSFSKVAGTTKKLLKWHETIFRYTKSNDFVFNIDALREPYSKSILQNLKHDENGDYYTRGLGTDTKIKRFKKTYIHPNGKLPGDVWNLGTYSPPKNERLGFPTQKPEILLERIIKVSSNPGEIVLDPFCGCGTTIAVAQKFNRHFVGIDVSHTACRLMQNRLKELSGKNIRIIGSPFIGEETRKLNHFDFQNLIIRYLGGRLNVKTGDMGIDGWDLDGIPIQIKQSDKVGRQIIDQFSSALRRYYAQLGNKDKKKEGLLICYSVTSGVWDERERLEQQENIYIKIITIRNKDSIERICENWNDRRKTRDLII